MVSETPGTWSLLGTLSVFNPQRQPIVKEHTDIKGRETWMVTHAYAHTAMRTHITVLFLKYNPKLLLHDVLLSNT